MRPEGYDNIEQINERAMQRLARKNIQPKLLPDGRYEFSIPQGKHILHVTAGTEGWEPTPEELDGLAGLFIQASEDPAGAVVVTRTGVIVDVLPLPEPVSE